MRIVSRIIPKILWTKMFHVLSSLSNQPKILILNIQIIGCWFEPGIRWSWCLWLQLPTVIPILVMILIKHLMLMSHVMNTCWEQLPPSLVKINCLISYTCFLCTISITREEQHHPCINSNLIFQFLSPTTKSSWCSPTLKTILIISDERARPSLCRFLFFVMASLPPFFSCMVPPLSAFVYQFVLEKGEEPPLPTAPPTLSRQYSLISDAASFSIFLQPVFHPCSSSEEMKMIKKR